VAYPELVRSGSLTRLIGLLAHENVDIVIDVIELIHELTDEEVGNEDEDEESTEETAAAMKSLVDGLVAFFSCSSFECTDYKPL
jgi:beta-catenin-like protein 1